MGEVIDLNKWRDKRSKSRDDSAVKDEMRASMDNDTVKRRYKLHVPPAPPTEEARLESIRESIQRINKTIAQLRDMTDDGGKAK